MIKNLVKAIMKRSQLKLSALNLTQHRVYQYKRNKNISIVSYIRKYSLKLNKVTDNKTNCKTIKPFLTDKAQM